MQKLHEGFDMTNTQARIETSKMIDTIRYSIEKFYGKALSELRGNQYQGTFDVTLRGSTRTADETLIHVYTEGEIIFYL
jgi:hypothetical protein